MPLTELEPARFEEAYAIMEASFPAAEIRAKEETRKLLKHPAYAIQVEIAANAIVGFIATWTLDAFSFVEHIAIGEGARGSGLGSRMMEEYMAVAVKPVILEVEEPETPVSIRRVRFYERLGFVLNRYGYRQPPLQPVADTPMLRLMSYPGELQEADFLQIREGLFHVVYKMY